MKPEQPICVALAGDSPKDPVLGRAVSLAKRMNAPLRLLRSVYNPLLEDASLVTTAGAFATRKSMMDSESKRLGRVAERLTERGLSVTSEVCWGHPAYTTIIPAVMRSEAQLLVAGTHSYGKAARLLLGHNDWQLARLCPVPLLLVKPGAPTRKAVVLAAVDPGHRHDKPAQLDDEILEAAMRWATMLHSRLHVAYAYQAPTPMMVGRFSDVPKEFLRMHHDAASTAFNALVKKASVTPARSHFVFGRPQDVLPALAKQLRARVVVLGGLSRGRLDQALIGSTVERVVDRLESDLLIIKARGFRPPASELGSTRRR